MPWEAVCRTNTLKWKQCDLLQAAKQAKKQEERSEKETAGTQAREEKSAEEEELKVFDAVPISGVAAEGPQEALEASRAIEEAFEDVVRSLEVGEEPIQEWDF